MSSHREAPEISKDPVADNTDVYAFVSPDRPDTVTLIANFIPLQGAAAGPNFYEFGDDVLYEIHIDNNGDGKPDVTYQLRFTTRLRNRDTFLYNTGPIESLDSPNWNRRQFYTVTRVVNGQHIVVGRDLPCPPCNIGPLSTPGYDDLATAAVHDLGHWGHVFAGQRADGFYVDLGSIFDLLDLRPFQNLNAFSPFDKAAKGVNTLRTLNVHSIALQVNKSELALGEATPTDPAAQASVIGVWATASRRKVEIRGETARPEVEAGPYVQVSRLGNPLVNEVLIPMGRKDNWNKRGPERDSRFAQFYAAPEVAKLLPAVYPGVFPNLHDLNESGKPRADLLAILLTGIPAGIVPGFQNYTGAVQADMLRLNLAVPPAEKPNILGLVAGDPAGFPNGRRVFDDVVTVELRAIAGLTYPLVDPSFTPDGATSLVTDGLTPDTSGISYLPHFPYLDTPHDGYSTPSS